MLWNQPEEDVYEKWKQEGPQPLAWNPDQLASEVGTVEEEMNALLAAVRQNGYDVFCVNLRDEIEKVLASVTLYEPDVIFNLVEYFYDDETLEPHFPALYELYDIPYTGNPSLTLQLCQNKVRTKVLLEDAGLPTSPYFVVEKEPIPDPQELELHYPLIVKPAREDASGGIEAESVVTNHDALVLRCRYIFKEFEQPALVEEYIEGREIHAAVLGNKPPEVLPLFEMEFDDSEFYPDEDEDEDEESGEFPTEGDGEGEGAGDGEGADSRELDSDAAIEAAALAEAEGVGSDAPATAAPEAEPASAPPAPAEGGAPESAGPGAPASGGDEPGAPESEEEGFRPQIISYRAKWDPNSKAFYTMDAVCPAENLEPEVEAHIKAIALRAYQVMGCRDYARIDMRVDYDGNPYILEVNPNPDLADGSAYVMCSDASGRTYAQVIGEIVKMALDRRPKDDASAKPAPVSDHLLREYGSPSSPSAKPGAPAGSAPAPSNVDAASTGDAQSNTGEAATDASSTTPSSEETK